MTIECYFTKCRYHASNEGVNGFYCTQIECQCTAKELKEFLSSAPVPDKVHGLYENSQEMIEEFTRKKPKTLDIG